MVYNKKVYCDLFCNKQPKINVMKKLLRTTSFLPIVFLIFSPFAAIAQSPHLVSYQAIIRDLSSNPLVNKPVSIDFTIRETSTSGPDVYSENHSVITTNLGMVNLTIGSGTTSGDFSLIDWSSGPFFLKVDIDGTEMGITQIVSAPYSLYSLRASNGLMGTAPNYYIENAKIGIGTKTPLSTLSVTGSNVLDSAIFEVKNNNGLTVFAVYNEGVRINIDENMKASKGGFAIGGFSGVKGTNQEYFRVTSDSTRVYVNNVSPLKGAKGGFAIGGFGGAKGTSQEYLSVTPDSTRVYVNNATMAKGAKGGFAIGGFDMSKAPVSNFVSLTQSNSLIGLSAGENITTGTKNFFGGYQAGKLTKEGLQNVFIGDMAGYNNNSSTNIFIGPSAGFTNTTGFGSVIIGDNAGYNNNGSRNIFIGRGTGKANTSGMDNVYIGSFSGEKITDAFYNTFLGVESGNFSTTGGNNVYLGHRAGYVNNGSNNVIIGDLSGAKNEIYDDPPTTYANSVFLGASSGSYQQSGSSNTYLGTYAGRTNIDGSGNVFIGNQAGQSELGSNKLYISNTSTSTPLIYGEFSNGDPAAQKVRIYGTLEVATLPVGGDEPVYFDLAKGQLMKQSSSRRYKDEISNLDVDLSSFMLLQPVTFKWNSMTASPGKEDLGLIAEEVNEVIPFLSVYNTDGTVEGVNYHGVNIMTLRVVQIQEERIKEMESALILNNDEISLLKEKISSYEIQVQRIYDELVSLKKQIKKRNPLAEANGNLDIKE